MSGFRSRRTLFFQGTLGFEKQVHRRWHFRGLRGKGFQQIVGIPLGTNCASLLADIFLYSYEAEFIQSLLSTGKKKLASQFHFTNRYIDDVLSINNPDIEIIWVKCIPLNLRSKTRLRATPLLPTRIYSFRSRVTVSCALSFTTNVTILTSISQTSNIPSSPAYGFFYLTTHTVCQGLLLLWMFYSKGGATFI